MKPHKLLLLLLGIWTIDLFGQTFGQTYGSQSLSLGTIGTLSPNGFEMFNNPALLANSNKTSLSLVQTAPYFQKELYQSGVSFVKPNKYLPLGIGLIHQGNDIFSQQYTSIAGAKKLSKHLFIGIGFHFLFTQQIHIKTRANFIGSLGMFFRLNDAWSFSTLMVNLNESKINIENKEHIPTILKIGASYKYSEELSLYAELEEIVRQKNISKIGLRYQLKEKFYLQFGYRNNPQIMSFGLTYLSEKKNIALATGFHQYLGFMPSVELQFNIAN